MTLDRQGSFFQVVLESIVAIFIAIVLDWALGPVAYQLNPTSGIFFYAVMIILILGLIFAVVTGMKRRL
jgi:uncharacterized membrane protein (DUF106 family)